MKPVQPSRRALLQGTGAAVVAGTALSACGSGAGAAAGGSGGSSGSGGSGGGASPGTVVGAVDQVPVGGGAIFLDTNVVVTQPTAGQFKGFSTRCTHQGCAVSSIVGGFIICPCHNSQFAISNGAPTSDSLAQQPLASIPVSVSGPNLVLG